MSVTNGERLVTKQDLADFYDNIRPYMGGVVTSKAGFTPIGTIISVMGTTAPANYLACDGTVYNIADYTELANYFNDQFGSKNYFGGNGTTTFAVPDLRGEFLRGTGTNSHVNQGDGDDVGVHQDGTEHQNVFVNNNTSAKTFYLAMPYDENKPQGDGTDRVFYGSVGYDKLYDIGKDAYLKLTGSEGPFFNSFYTSRPTNTSVLYCIATKNFYVDPTLDYSTDEKVVGTWIDGKPLYQKTIVGTMPSELYDSKYSKAYPIGASIDFGFIVQASFVVGASIQQLFTINDALSTSKLGKVGIATNEDTINPNCVYIRTNNADWINLPCYITIQYTKTTT